MDLSPIKQVKPEEMATLPEGTIIGIVYKYPTDSIMRLRSLFILKGEPNSQERVIRKKWAEPFAKETGAVYIQPTQEETMLIINELLKNLTQLASAAVLKE